MRYDGTDWSERLQSNRFSYTSHNIHTSGKTTWCYLYRGSFVLLASSSCILELPLRCSDIRSDAQSGDFFSRISQARRCSRWTGALSGIGHVRITGRTDDDACYMTTATQHQTLLLRGMMTAHREPRWTPPKSGPRAPPKGDINSLPWVPEPASPLVFISRCSVSPSRRPHPLVRSRYSADIEMPMWST